MKRARWPGDRLLDGPTGEQVPLVGLGSETLIGYLMTGRDIAHYTTGSVQTQMFEDAYGLPEYEVKHGFGNAS